MRFIASLAALCALGASEISFAADDSWLIFADKIYTAPDTAPLSNGTVLTTGDRIAAVGDERARPRIPRGTRSSECRGVVVAGFQNSHVHLMGPAFANATDKPAAELEGAISAMLTRYGVTTAFDTGSDLANTLAIRSRIDKGEVKGPRILTVGWPIYPRDGIPFYLRDLPPAMLEQLRQPKDAAEALENVRANLAAGTDGTKLFVVTTPQLGTAVEMLPEIARAAADETHARGKLVLSHPTSIAGIRNALNAGVDIVVHTTLGERQPWDEALTREMVEKKMSLVPTLKLWPYELAKQQVPQFVVDQLVGATIEELRTFKAAGGQILFGTDVGYMHEFDPTDEYVLMSKAGLSAMDILASLTTAPAERWQESQRRGRVEPGMAADLVVLGGDPADDVKNFADVRCVFRAGKLIYSAEAGLASEKPKP
jgi:imidazolonepropionase-like amidohydrolase